MLQLQCAAGYYCPAGSVVPTEIPCPESSGLYCGPGSKNPDTLCPEGYYCPFVDQKTRCPDRNYCLQGSLKPYPCGTFSTCVDGLPRPGWGIVCIIICLVIFVSVPALVAHRWLAKRQISENRSRETEQAMSTRPLADDLCLKIKDLISTPLLALAATATQPPPSARVR